MTEIKGRENTLNWICRILFTLDVISLISGYLSFIQTRNQLVSPLIPDSTVARIIADSRFYEASIGAGIFLLAGLWFYSFNRNKIAVVLFIIAFLTHQLLPFFLINSSAIA